MAQRQCSRRGKEISGGVHVKHCFRGLAVWLSTVPENVDGDIMARSFTIVNYCEMQDSNVFNTV